MHPFRFDGGASAQPATIPNTALSTTSPPRRELYTESTSRPTWRSWSPPAAAAARRVIHPCRRCAARWAERTRRAGPPLIKPATSCCAGRWGARVTGSGLGLQGRAGRHYVKLPMPTRSGPPPYLSPRRSAARDSRRPDPTLASVYLATPGYAAARFHVCAPWPSWARSICTDASRRRCCAPSAAGSRGAGARLLESLRTDAPGLAALRAACSHAPTPSPGRSLSPHLVAGRAPRTADAPRPPKASAATVAPNAYKAEPRRAAPA